MIMMKCLIKWSEMQFRDSL